MKDENLLLIVIAMLLFGALFSYVNFDSHKVTWKGIDSLRTKGELLELMIQRIEKNTIVFHDTIKVHDTIYVNVPNIDQIGGYSNVRKKCIKEVKERTFQALEQCLG